LRHYLKEWELTKPYRNNPKHLHKIEAENYLEPEGIRIKEISIFKKEIKDIKSLTNLQILKFLYKVKL
jgi:hypothetical protein